MKEKTFSIVNDLTNGPILKKLILFALPFMAANLLNTLYTLVDLAVVGKYLGSAALAAASNSGEITMLLYAIGIGLGNGGQVLMSQLTGAKRRDEYQSTIGTMLTFGLLSAVVVAVIGIVGARSFLGFLNTPSESFEMAVDYLITCAFGYIFCVGYQTVACILRGMGDSKTPFLIIGICAVLNLILDILLVAVIPLGVIGAALATTISQFCSFVFSIVYLYPKRAAFGFDFKPKSFRIDPKKLAIILRLSVPLMVSSICISFSMMFISSYVNPFGVVAAAVTGVGNKLVRVLQVITQAMQTATGGFVGQNMGARQPDRARKSVWLATGISIGFWAIVASVCVLFPRAVFSLFNNEPPVLDMAVDYLHIAIWNFLATAAMAAPLGLMSGVGASGLQMAVSLLDGVAARIGLSLLFGVGLSLGLEGFWIGSALASYVTVILGWAYFLSKRWKNRILV